MSEFKRVGRFSDKDPDLDRRLLELQKNVEDALIAIGREKRDRFTFRESKAASVQAAFGECVVLDTSGSAIDCFLPAPTPNDRGKRVGVVRFSATNAVTTRAPGTTIGGSATHTPSTGVMTEYETNGAEWWVS